MENEFEFCDVMRLLEEKGTFEQFYSIKKYNGNDKVVSIPEEYDNLKVYEIGSYCFEENDTVEEVILPKSVLSIGSDAFSFCTNLDRINLENIKYIDVGAFSNSGIKSVALNNIKEINMSAFSDCENLQEVIIGEGIKEINENAFSNCPKLKKVILPESLEKIGKYAFSECNNISEIVLSDKTEVSKNAFEKNVMEIIKNTNKNTKLDSNTYDLEYLLNETREKKIEEIEKYIKDLLKEHKLDKFDTSDITDLNTIGFNKDTGEITWKCHKCGYCTFYLWDLLADNGKMIDNFNNMRMWCLRS